MYHALLVSGFSLRTPHLKHAICCAEEAEVVVSLGSVFLAASRGS